MICVEIERTIDRPITEVFERLVNIPDYSKWLPKSRVFLHTRQTSVGPVGLGTTFIDETRFGTFRGEINAFQSPTKVGFRMDLHWLTMKVLESRPTYELEPADSSTRVELNAEGELYGVFRVMEPYVAMRAREERKRTIDVLKRTLEATSR